jgi:acid phosphatase type 7
MNTMLAGDIAYADYWLKEEIQGFLPNISTVDGAKAYESLLNMFDKEMTPISSKTPYMVGLGNHEANCKTWLLLISKLD